MTTTRSTTHATTWRTSITAFASVLVVGCSVSVGDSLDADEWCPFAQEFQDLVAEQNGQGDEISFDDVIDHLSDDVPSEAPDDLRTDVGNIRDFYVNTQAGQEAGVPYSELENDFQRLIDVPLVEFQASVDDIEAVTQELCDVGFQPT